MKMIRLLSVALPLIAASFAMAAAKKTVCSATLNSSEEIETFKKNLSLDQWNFIELTTYQPSESSHPNASKDAWLRQACEQKISCDILIISGHFAGSFFGQTDLKLPLNSLETATCDTKCDGILKNPKEVFLFGCNTLAGKDGDHRNPEEYRRVLIEDGFSEQQAQQVVAFRYSQFGESFKGRMSQVFSSTPRIYGFSSVGPSGKNVQDMLNSYLKQSKNNYSSFDEYVQTSSTTLNKTFLNSLKVTAVAQTAGLYIQTNIKSEKPYCYLGDERTSVAAKLLYIKKLLEEGRALSNLSYIQSFFTSLEQSKHQFTSSEKDILASIQENQKLKEDFKGYLKLKGDAYLQARVDILNIMHSLQLLNEEEYHSGLASQIDLGTVVPLERKDRICSLDIHTPSIDVASINPANLKNEQFYKLLACLRPTTLQIQEIVANAILSNTDNSVWIAAASVLHATGEVNLKVLNTLADALYNKTLSWYVRNVILAIINSSKSPDLTLIHKVAESSLNDTEAFIRSNAISTLLSMKTTDPKIIATIIPMMSSYSLEQVSAITFIAQVKPATFELANELVNVIVNDDHPSIRNLTLAALANSKFDDPRIIKRLTDLLFKEQDSLIAVGEIRLISKSKTQAPETLEALKTLSMKAPNSLISSEALAAYKELTRASRKSQN